MTVHLSTVARMGAGVCITGIVIRYLEVSHPVTIVGLTVMGQALAWMPDFVSRCLRVVRGPETPFSLSAMPPEVLARVQGSLDRNDRAAASLSHVNRYLRDSANDPYGAAIYRFEFKDSATLRELRNLKALNPKFSRPEKEFELDLSFNDMTDAELQDIVAYFPSITKINATKCTLGKNGLQILEGLKNLTELDLSFCMPITNTGLRSLAELTKLEKLDLSQCRKITDAGLQSLVNLTKLKKLDLTGCYQITHAGRASLAVHLPNLIITG